MSHQYDDEINVNRMEATDEASLVNKVLLETPELLNHIFVFLKRTPHDLSALDATCKTFRNSTQPIWESLMMENHYEVGVSSHKVEEEPDEGDRQQNVTRKVRWDSRNVFWDLWSRKFEKLDLSLVDFEGVEDTYEDCDVLWCPGRIQKVSKTRVVLNNHAEEDADTTFIAVPDTLDSTRFFVGQLVDDPQSADRTSTLIGGVCYFDSNGKMESPITTFSQVVFQNGMYVSAPSPNNVILCGEVLIIAYRWSRLFRGTSLSLGGFIVQGDSLSSVFGWTKIKTGNTEGREVNAWHPEIKFGRWLCLEDDDKKNKICIDMKSFRTVMHENERDEITLYDRVVLPSGVSPMAALKSIEGRLPAYKWVTEDWQGYPVNCVKSDKATVTATTSLEGCRSMSLGNGVCLDCKIRYSVSSKEWKCTRFAEDDKKLHCDATVGAARNFVCSVIHDDPDLYCVQQKSETRLNRSYQLRVELKIQRKKTDNDDDDGPTKKKRN